MGIQTKIILFSVLFLTQMIAQNANSDDFKSYQGDREKKRAAHPKPPLPQPVPTGQSPRQPIQRPQYVAPKRRLSISQKARSVPTFQKKDYEIYAHTPAPSETLQLVELQKRALRMNKMLQRLNTEKLQKLMELMASGEIIDPLLDRLEMMNYKKFLIYQVVLFLIYLLIRSWYTAKAKANGIFKKLIGGMFISLSFLGLSLFGLPSLFLGRQYLQLIEAIAKIFI